MVSEAARAGVVLALALCTGAAPAGAGLLDDLKQVARDAVDEAVDGVGDVAAEDASQASGQAAPATGSPAPAEASAGAPAATPSGSAPRSTRDNVASGSYIGIDALPTAPMPLLSSGLNMLRLKYEPDYRLDDDALVAVTRRHILCHRITDGDLVADTRRILQSAADGEGCLAERAVYSDRGRLPAWHMVRIFPSDAIAGRNPEFAAQPFKHTMGEQLRAAAAHMAPRFAETVTWRGEYDFATGELVVDAGPYQPLPDHKKRRYLPPGEQGRDAYEPPRRLRGTPFRPLRVIWPYVPAGVQAVAFDRQLGEGRYPLPAGEAEALFANEKVYDRSGRALVEYTVETTADGAALARLDRVRLLARKGREWDDMEVYLEVPVSAFPR